MKDITEILKSLRNVRLDAHEKNAMRSRLVQHINSEVSIPSPVVSWYGILWSHQFKVGYASLFITLSVGSTVVFAAEQALPGDILYAVKTKVNEQVERAFVPSEPIQLAQFETKLVERRFEEAEKLDEKKLLVKEDTKSKAREEIEKQTEKAEKAIAKARTINQIEVASALVQPVAEPAANMMMRSFSVSENDNDDDVEDDQSSKRGKNSDSSSRKEQSNDDGDDNDRRGKDNDAQEDEDDESDLEKVFKKHSDIVKKLDIKKNNRSRDDR